MEPQAGHVLQPPGQSLPAPVSQGRVRVLGGLSNHGAGAVGVRLLREVRSCILAHDRGILGGELLHGCLARLAFARPLGSVGLGVELPEQVERRQVEGVNSVEVTPAVEDASRVSVGMTGDSQVRPPLNEA